MAKPSSQDRRKQVLKQRRAELKRQEDQTFAEYLYQDGLEAYRQDDVSAAGRLLKKALNLNPDHAGALNLLALIHEDAGRHAEALECLGRERKVTSDPTVIYNIGVIYGRMGQPEQGARAMADFLAAAKGIRDPKLRPLRDAAQAAVSTSVLRAPAVQPPPPRKPSSPPRQCAEPQPAPNAKEPQPAPNAKEPQPAPNAKEPQPAPKAEQPPPRVAMQVLSTASPDFASGGTVADYFLRRRCMELRMAQNFEDLLCLPSLEGVDAYIYQQETVRRVLRHFKGRALLADEVGLGKTIEACLVLKEYWVRGLVKKALVLTPPSLVSQWKGELTEKFGLPPASPDSPDFRRDPEQFWNEQPLVVASIAMARLESHAAAISAAPWDMVIVDEAHCLKNRASANWRLVDSLQKKFILMLTATPVENNLLELYNLITLLKPGLLATEAEFRKLYVTPGKPKAPKNPEKLRTLLAEVMIRNTRAAADVQLPKRIAASVNVTPSDAEAQIYDIVSHFVARRYRPDRGVQALDLMQRQAGSSPAALARSVARALAADGWAAGDRWAAQDRRELEAVLDLASGLDTSSKAEQLGRMLGSHPGKAVVFTEFIPTLDDLRRTCDRCGISYALFTGDLSRPEKDAAIARFRDHAQVLLSTGSGGEGRNLQFADTIVNFDLPWNPMRIEQRVGRVHRIGQTRDVFVFNFCQRGTVEEQLLRVLHDKINMFELVVGEMDAILGTLDDSRDFADIVMELWISGRESGELDRNFDELATRLLDSKKRHIKVQELDETLFARDFEV